VASEDAVSTGRLARLRRMLPLPRARGTEDASPRVTFSKADARRLNERFAMLDRQDRRAIVRSVNRGVPMTRKRDAELAVGVARRQQRFWTRAWLLGPAIAVVQVVVTPIGWVEGLLLGAWGAVLLGLMAAWWWTRARRAELENLKVIGGRAGRESGRGGSGSDAAARRRSRLPGGPATGGAADTTVDEDGEGHDGAEGLAPRPPRPRGRKRR
jgi:anti-sigma factor RsiW